MKCFYHTGKDAVAVCHYCNRPLCPKCVASVPTGAACKNKCEKHLAAVRLVLANKRAGLRQMSMSYRRSATGIFMMGCIFILLGVFSKKTTDSIFPFVMGPLFFVFAYLNYKKGKRIESKE